MMLKISRISILLILTAVIVTNLAPQFKKIFFKKSYNPYVRYSSVLKDFIVIDRNKDEGSEYYDRSGRVYSQIEYQKMLPMVYYKNLSLWKTFPKEINGVSIDLYQIDLNYQFIRLKSETFNQPEISLYPLYESASIFSEIESPDSMFRINSIEFIKTETNKIEKQMSEDFTEALLNHGFVFPAKGCYGNPTTRKPFDEGYFIVDSKGEIFHMKQVKGAPFVKKTGIQPEKGIRHIMFEENLRKEFYGLMLTETGEFYLIMYDNYITVKLPITVSDPEYFSLSINCDMVKRTITLNTKDKIKCVATDLNYNVIDTYDILKQDHDEKANKYSDIVFPFKIKLSKPGSVYTHFIMKYSKKGLILSLVLAVCFTVFFKLKKYRFIDHIADFIIIGTTGISGLIAVFAVGAYRNMDMK